MRARNKSAQNLSSVIVHSSASDKLAVESFTRLACLGLSRIPVKEREIVSFQSKICELVSGKLSKCLYSAISRKVVGKNVHATIPKGNMGDDQYTVPDDCTCRTYFCCFP